MTHLTRPLLIIAPAFAIALYAALTVALSTQVAPATQRAPGSATRNVTWLVSDRTPKGVDVATSLNVPAKARVVYYVTPGVSDSRSARAALFTSFAAFNAALAHRRIPRGVHLVAYDPEKWAATPAAEQRNPVTYMLRFTATARRHGLGSIIVPGRDLVLAPGASCSKFQGETVSQAFVTCDLARGAQGATYFVLQDAPEEGEPAIYARVVHQVARQVKSDSPKTTLLITVSTSALPLDRLVSLTRRTLHVAGGIEVNTTPHTLGVAARLINQIEKRP